MLSLLLFICISVMETVADVSDNIAVHVTPVQQAQLDEQVLLECNMTSSDISKVLTGLRLAWYDGFIPLTPVIENVTDLKHQIVVNISVNSWLQYGRYECKVESEKGTLVKKTAVLPPGIEQDQLIQQDVGLNEPGRITISCPITSHGITWSLLTMNYTELTLDHHNPNFTFDLTSYDKSVKAMCFGGGHYSMQYVYPINYEPVRFIFPAEENTTTMFYSNDPKLIECKTTGSLRPSITWFRNGVKLESDIVRRLHIAEVSSNNSSPYVLQINIFSPVPFVDSGKYVCVVENKWEVVNRSIHIRFDFSSKNHFTISTFSRIHFMYAKVQFKATCIVQASLSMQAGITMGFAYRTYNDSNAIWTVSSHATTHGDRVSFSVMEEIKEDSRWIIATIKIADVIQDDSGLYECIASSFAEIKSRFSLMQYFEVPLQIIAYEPKNSPVEKGSPVLITCDIEIENVLLNYNLFSVSFHYYATDENMPILYNADLQNLDNRTIRATLNKSRAGYQDAGIYECYVRTLSVDGLLIGPTDNFDFYADARNTSLKVTPPVANDHNKSDDSSSHTTIIIIVSVVCIISAITLAGVVFLACYIQRHYKAKRFSSFPKKQNHYVNM